MTCLARSQDPQDWRLSDLEPGLLRFDRIAQAVKVENNHPAFQWKKKIKQKKKQTKPWGKAQGTCPHARRTEGFDYQVLQRRLPCAFEDHP